MKNIKFIFIAFIAVLGSCSNEERGKPAPIATYPVYFNNHRVKSIIETNETAGIYNKYSINYEDIELSLSPRCNNIGDTTGNVNANFSATFSMYTYSSNDIIPTITQDSILRLDAELSAKYGDNYSLKDSIKYSTQTGYKVTALMSDDGTRVLERTNFYYSPREDIEIPGEKYKYTYYITRKVTDFYEYNEDARIIVCRTFVDIYPNKDASSETERDAIYKYEIDYNGEKISSITKYNLPAGNSYIKYETYSYSYSGNRLISITGDNGYKKDFIYSGNTCVVTENGVKLATYELGPSDYPTKITDEQGNIKVVTYEEGHGKYGIITEFEKEIFGSPYIR